MSPLTPRRLETADLPHAVRGYDRQATDRLLEEVAASYEEIWLERKSLREQVAKLESELEQLSDRERVVSEALLTAQRAADEIRTEARREAETLVEEARAERERLEALIAGMRGLVETAWSDLSTALEDTLETLTPESIQPSAEERAAPDEGSLIHDLTQRRSTARE
jgi:cell division septum initiation protein DivIVA